MISRQHHCTSSNYRRICKGLETLGSTTINTFKYHVFTPMGRWSFVVITTFSTGLVGVEVTSVSWLGQLTVLQDRNNLLLDGRTVENKGKLILTTIKSDPNILK